MSVVWLRVLFSIGVNAGARVRFVEQFDRVANLELHSGELRARTDLHLAPGIARRKYFRVRVTHVGQLLLQNASRHFRLQEVVNSGRAAATLSAFERNEIRTDRAAEQVLRRIARVLAVQKVA
jgi:hypothetical protein